MNCPKCSKHVEDNLSFCPYCGERVRSGSSHIAGVDYVYDETRVHRHHRRRKKKGSKIILIVIAALIVGIGAISFWVLNRRNNSSASSAATSDSAADNRVIVRSPEMPSLAPPVYVPPTTVPATTVPPTTKAPETTAAPGGRMEEYARSSGMIDLLKDAVDEHTTISVTGEENALRARYRVDLDSAAGENAEYFELLPSTYDDLCARIDKMVYDMNQQSDISNAVLEIYVFDSNGTQVYSNTVD